MAEENLTASDAANAAGEREEPQEGTQDTSQEDARHEEPEADGRVRRANEEARKYRERAKTAEAELERTRKAGMTETERLQADHEQAKTRVADLETTNTHLRVQLAALKAGVRPSLATDVPKLLDLSEVDDPSDQKQIEKAVRQFLKDRSEYVADAGMLDAGATSPQRPNGKATLGSFIRREAGIQT